MKKLRKLIALLLLLLYALALPAGATSYVEYDGLEVTVEMDQEQYENGVPMTATITVTNTNNRSVMIVNLEQLIPEGFVLAEGSVASKNNFEIQAGETIVLQVTFTGETLEEPEDDPDGLEISTNFLEDLVSGVTWGIPNLFLVFAVVALIVIFMALT